MGKKGSQETLAECANNEGHNEDWRNADVITGGFPCQDISLAGPGTGISGARSGLWKYLCGTIRMVRPLYAIVENVAALLNRGMGVVLGDLAEVGYDTEWHCIPASYVGAQHLRDRIWIIAHVDRKRKLQQEGGIKNERERVGDGSQKNDSTDINQARLSRGMQAGENIENVGKIIARLRSSFVVENGISRNYWNYQPLMGRGIHGVSRRLDRTAMLGNSVVPQIPEIIGRAILEVERRK